MNTTDQVYVIIKESQRNIKKILVTSKNNSDIKIHIENFEDVVNRLSGDILNLDKDQQAEIQNENSNIGLLCSDKGIQLYLHDSVLKKSEKLVNTDLTTVLAKKLYPHTESLQVETTQNTQQSTQNTEIAATPEEIAIVEDVDTLFDEMDAEEVVYDPLAQDQSGFLPLLSDDMESIATEAANTESGLQDGLATFCYNPLAEIIDTTTNTLLYYTENNYANMNVSLIGLYSDSLLETEYKAFQSSIAGNDGLSGSISLLRNFKDHTDRLSGLILDKNSPNHESTDDSTVDNLALNDYSGGPTVLFNFDSRKFRSAKYMIQASADITDRGHQATEIYILHDNHAAFTKEITSIYTQEPFVTYTTRLIDQTIQVLATTTVDNTNFVLYGTRLKIAKESQSYPEISQQAIINLHKNMSAYLNNGVDYIGLISNSLKNPQYVGELSREFTDYISNFSSSSFLSLSTGEKAAGLLAAAAVITEKKRIIQDSIDQDWTNFTETRKQSEALDIAFNLTSSFTDPVSNTIPSLVLNTKTIEAINE